MHPFFIATAFAVALASCASVSPVNDAPRLPVFDFSGLEAYYDLTDHVQAGGTLTDERWEAFISVKGNRLSIEKNNTSKAYLDELRRQIELVYSPENDSSLQAALPEDFFLQIRKRYKDFEADHREHLAKLRAHPEELRDSSLRLTRQFLPPRMHSATNYPTVYFHALWDSSSNEEGVFIDILAQYDFDQRALGLMLGHEVHHYLRASLLEDVTIESQDEGVIYALESILHEGLANMIDKPRVIYEGSDWWLSPLYLERLAVSADVIVALDTQIIAEANELHGSEQIYRDLMHSSVGHIPGQYMAQTILNAGRIDEVIVEADNAFTFFKLYQEVAVLSEGKHPVFSERTMRYLQVLSDKYLMQ